MLTAENKLVSIAMTTYNGEKYVEKQLRSIFTQTRQPDEIIICDDCSKDHTLEIVRRIVAEYKAEDRVRLVENQQNLGYIRNFHQAIGMTSGDYLFLADQDDEWYPHKLERVLEVMEETGAAAICTGFDESEAQAVGIVLEKACMAAFLAECVGNIPPLDAESAKLDREGYINHYSKLK